MQYVQDGRVWTRAEILALELEENQS
jgi:hypothetical protein